MEKSIALLYEKDLTQSAFKIYFIGIFSIKTVFKIKGKKVLYSVTKD